jgi:hypothetical protein
MMMMMIMMMMSGMVASRNRKKEGKEKDKSEARVTDSYRCDMSEPLGFVFRFFRVMMIGSADAVFPV